MPYYLSDNNFLNYVRSGYTLSPTHGNNETLHGREMEDICNIIIDKKLNEYSSNLENKIESMIDNRIRQSLDNYIKGMKYDCEVIAEVILDSGQNIFNKRELKQIITDNIYNTMLSQLNNKTFIVK